MSTTTEEIGAWVKEYGSERDALNVALAKLQAARFQLNELRDAIPWEPCPRCNGVIVEGWICLNCNFDDSIQE
jgi:hypothetical protein